MPTNKIKNNYTVYLAGFFFVLLLFNIFTVTKLPVRALAFTTLEWTYFIGLMLFGYYLVNMIQLEKSLRFYYLGCTLYFAVIIMAHFVNRNYFENEAFNQFLLIVLFFVAISHVKWKQSHYLLFANISLVILALLFIHWIAEGLPMDRYRSLIRNPNILGIFVASIMFFPIIAFRFGKKGHKILFSLGIFLGLVLIYVSSARAVLLLLATVVGARLILMLSKRLFHYLFYIVIAFNFIFLMIYSLLAKTKYFEILNNWSSENFGKNFFSGRQNIWEPAMKFGLEQPFFGHKIGIVPKDYIEGTHYAHAHNQYLQLFLESGFVGIAFFLLFLFGIWKTYQRGLESSIVQWSACFFLGLLIYQSMEISLFFNMESVGVFHWFIISIGISGVLVQSERTGEERKSKFRSRKYNKTVENPLL